MLDQNGKLVGHQISFLVHDAVAGRRQYVVCFLR